jgi:Phage protein Gp138 N-terminal domain
MSDSSAGSGSGSSSSGGKGNFGQRGLMDSVSHFHWLSFAIKQWLAETRTAHPVKISKVTGGGVGPPPTVDVQLLVKQMDGIGNSSSHSTVYGRPVGRVQGGKNAIICDPVQGDIHHMIVSDRDISSVVANSGEATPGSYRRHHVSDGVVHGAGAMVNKDTPNNYIDINGHIHMLSADDVTITDKAGNVVTMNSSKIYVKPGSNVMIYLGGDGTTGTYDFVSTPSGPSINTLARTG